MAVVAHISYANSIDHINLQRNFFKHLTHCMAFNQHVMFDVICSLKRNQRTSIELRPTYFGMESHSSGVEWGGNHRKIQFCVMD